MKGRVKGLLGNFESRKEENTGRKSAAGRKGIGKKDQNRRKEDFFESRKEHKEEKEILEE